MKKIDFTAEKDCRRLDVFVAEYADVSRSHAGKLVESGAVIRNGKAVDKVSCGVKKGDEITVIFPDERQLGIPAEDIPIDVVYEDGDLAVINKQQGLTVHPANNVNTGTLVNALLYRIKDLSGINGVLRPGIVHRIDKDTSGLLLVAKNDTAHRSLAEQIKKKECRRIYIALLEGVLKEDSGVIDKPIARSRKDRKQMTVDETGRSAVTLYTVKERFAEFTLVEFELRTGRTHQIRVHARYIGHPVVGDKTYGYKNQRFNLNGQLLHAEKIVFRHPSTDEVMEFTAPIPTYFANILNIVGAAKKQ